MNVQPGLLIPLLILILAAAVLVWLSRRRKLPGGKVIYEDLVRDGEAAQALYSRTYGLSGKPDLILRKGKELIPVEIKHASGASGPRPSHMMQLAAYCLLIEENYGIRPSRGIIRYRDTQYEIPCTDRLIKQLLETLSTMRSASPENNLPPRRRSRRCSACGYAKICGQADR